LFFFSRSKRTKLLPLRARDRFSRFCIFPRKLGPPSSVPVFSILSLQPAHDPFLSPVQMCPDILNAFCPFCSLKCTSPPPSGSLYGPRLAVRRPLEFIFSPPSIMNPHSLSRALPKLFSETRISAFSGFIFSLLSFLSRPPFFTSVDLFSFLPVRPRNTACVLWSRSAPIRPRSPLRSPIHLFPLSPFPSLFS